MDRAALALCRVADQAAAGGSAAAQRGNLKLFQRLLRLEAANVSLAALYQKGETIPYGLYETTGQDSLSTLALPFSVRAATLATLLKE